MNYLSTLEAATAAGLSQDRIRALVVKGLIPGAVKVGKTWLVPRNFRIIRNGKHGPKSTITGPQQ
jgi:hypothetical protein